MMSLLSPWWQQVSDAVELLTSSVNAAVSQAGRDGVYTPPPGTPPPRRRRTPGSLRHLAEVIRTQRLAPGVSIDKDIVAGVLAGELPQVTDPVLVIAVVRAARIIAGASLTDAEARQLTVACEHIKTLVNVAHDADQQAPHMLPARLGAAGRLDDSTVEKVDDSGPPFVIEAYRTTGRPRRRWLVGLACVVLLAVGVGVGAMWAPTRGTPSVAVGAPCTGKPPAVGADLLEVPHAPADEDPHMEDWWRNDGRVGNPAGDLHNFMAVVQHGTAEPSDLLIVHSCNPIVRGRHYVLTFAVVTDNPVLIQVRVQDNRPPDYTASLDEAVKAGAVAQRLVYRFAGVVTNPGTELAFLVGGHEADFTLHVSDISLTALDG